MLGPILGLAVSGRTDDLDWHPFALSGGTSLTGGAFGVEGGWAASLAVVAGIIVLPLICPVSSPRRPGHREDLASIACRR